MLNDCFDPCEPEKESYCNPALKALFNSETNNPESIYDMKVFKTEKVLNKKPKPRNSNQQL